MTIPKWLVNNLIPLLLIASSVIVGWSIPWFYDWTDSDQSRPSRLLWQVPMWSAIGSLAFCGLLPWLRIARPHSEDVPRTWMRFSLRGLFIITAVAAASIPLVTRFPGAGSLAVCVGIAIHSVWFWLRYPPHRVALAALISCMILPYAWVIGYEELDRILLAFIWMLGAMPTFVPAGLISGLLGQRFGEPQWIAHWLTSFEYAAGIAMICLGPKRAIAYLLLVLQVSAFGSLVFYQLCVF